MKCEFIEAYRGKCGKDIPCEKHEGLKCDSCGNTATRSCSATIGLVCGAPLCPDCEHELNEKGVNILGRKHVRKSEQENKPWYV